jgi:hypothetical protein
VRAYFLLEATLEASRSLDRGYRAGGTLRGGWLLDVGERWRFQVEGGYAVFPFGHHSAYPRVTLAQRYAVSRNWDVRFEFDRLQTRRQWSLAANWYF